MVNCGKAGERNVKVQLHKQKGADESSFERTWGYDLVGRFEKKSVKFRENINFIEEHAGIYKLYPILIGTIGQLINICRTMTYLIIPLRVRL